MLSRDMFSSMAAHHHRSPLLLGQAQIHLHPSYTLLSVNFIHNQLQTVEVHDDLYMYLGVYIGLSIACCLVSTLRFFLINYAAVQSSKSLFQDLLSRDGSTASLARYHPRGSYSQPTFHLPFTHTAAWRWT